MGLNFVLNLPIAHSFAIITSKDYLSIYSRLLGLSRFFFFSFLIFYKVGRIPWSGDQPVPRPLPVHRTAQTQNKRTEIHASSEIGTHDPGVETGEDVLPLRPRRHCDRPSMDRWKDKHAERWIERDEIRSSVALPPVTACCACYPTLYLTSSPAP
jgi:hypothetical protein